MKKRGWWWLVAAVMLVAIGAGVEWRLQRVVSVPLPVLNRTGEPVQLLIYGDGLTEHVMIAALPPRDTVVVTLHLSPRGPVRIQSSSARAQIDAQLIGDNAELRDRPLQFEVRPGNQFVLVPRL